MFWRLFSALKVAAVKFTDEVRINETQIKTGPAVLMGSPRKETLLYTFAWSSLFLHMESRPPPSLSGLTDGEVHVAQQFDSRYGLRKAETRNVNCRLVCLRTKGTTALCFPVPEWPARPRTPATGVGVEPAMVLEGTDHIAMPPRRTGRTESVIMAVKDSIFVAASGVC
ncbi:hypothetical protein N656DRAFT_35481 [Canariomyces notabilis]|uniref:Uncharacterized protein n=1 Tax=Canariomyces notabilis TaxID=2074819 RepID=A0AAN6TMY6_9PEZI|nr:hypothetical protein N656DRAFT_35481 [Canariomyces arenarius]